MLESLDSLTDLIIELSFRSIQTSYPSAHIYLYPPKTIWNILGPVSLQIPRFIRICALMEILFLVKGFYDPCRQASTLRRRFANISNTFFLAELGGPSRREYLTNLPLFPWLDMTWNPSLHANIANRGIILNGLAIYVLSWSPGRWF